jgi:hypothetical protein
MSNKQHLSVSAIETRRAEMASRLEKVQEARRELALPALEGDKEAKTRDGELVEKARQYGEALTQFDAALVSARAREDAARREEQAAAAHAKAADARKRLAALRRHGADLDCAVRTMIESYTRFEAEIAELARMRIGPSTEVVRVGCRRSLEYSVMSTPLRTAYLAPGERHKFGDLITGWGSQIEASIAMIERENAITRAA